MQRIVGERDVMIQRMKVSHEWALKEAEARREEDVYALRRALQSQCEQTQKLNDELQRMNNRMKQQKLGESSPSSELVVRPEDRDVTTRHHKKGEQKDATTRQTPFVEMEESFISRMNLELDQLKRSLSLSLQNSLDQRDAESYQKDQEWSRHINTEDMIQECEQAVKRSS